jgi:hypothetical protein
VIGLKEGRRIVLRLLKEPANQHRQEGHLGTHNGGPFRGYAPFTRHDLPCAGPTQSSESWLAGRVNTASGIDRRHCVCSDRAPLPRRRPSDIADSGKLRTAKPAQSD